MTLGADFSPATNRAEFLGVWRLLELFDQLASQTVLLMRTTLDSHASLGWTPPVEVHRHIAQGIADRNVELAVRAVGAHYQYTQDRLSMVEEPAGPTGEELWGGPEAELGADAVEEAVAEPEPEAVVAPLDKEFVFRCDPAALPAMRRAGIEIANQANNHALDQGVEGVVILPMPRQRDLSALLDWEYYSVVSVTSSVTAPRVHTVTPNHFDNIIRACRQLTEAGYRRIGLAISRDWDERVRHRWTGGVAWQNAFGGTVGKSACKDSNGTGVPDWTALTAAGVPPGVAPEQAGAAVSASAGMLKARGNSRTTGGQA